MSSLQTRFLIVTEPQGFHTDISNDHEHKHSCHHGAKKTEYGRYFLYQVTPHFQERSAFRVGEEMPGMDDG